MEKMQKRKGRQREGEKEKKKKDFVVSCVFCSVVRVE